ncbi:MAG: RNase adapter RapZ [Gammaproteobacteria bacterium]|nr:RNase adapter RapZ [Gammaproteobacteria bacterium]MDH4256032.1 RNase adapter RapZ [Gammaproteobacteria bacterium]MDH5308667.1 RNase adapter RapZ [Gammaproteobacteria bacterium]MDH5501543.1 RNase adapter RapZ [Gammaproteobacteria bacterium]
MDEKMRLIIVSGLSGSGKSVALHVLEDLGYYCIDNLPAALINALVKELTDGSNSVNRIAVGVDARNPQKDLESLPRLIKELRAQGTQTDLLFLQTSDDVLLKRYSESRRRHPLSVDGTELRAAIDNERALLGPIINAADLIVDTTRSSVYELADLIRERVDRRQSNMLSVLVESFGFKHGIPADADFVFDLRCLPNPYWQPELRPLTGLDQPVKEFLESQELFRQMFDDVHSFLIRWIPEYVSFNRGYLTVAIGCTGGQHRSVYMTEKLVTALKQSHDPVLSRHCELGQRAGSKD